MDSSQTDGDVVRPPHGWTCLGMFLGGSRARGTLAVPAVPRAGSAVQAIATVPAASAHLFILFNGVGQFPLQLLLLFILMRLLLMRLMTFSRRGVAF